MIRFIQVISYSFISVFLKDGYFRTIALPFFTVTSVQFCSQHVIIYSWSCCISVLFSHTHFKQFSSSAVSLWFQLEYRCCFIEFMLMLLPYPGFMNSCSFPLPCKLSFIFSTRLLKKTIAHVTGLMDLCRSTTKPTFGRSCFDFEKTRFLFQCMQFFHVFGHCSWKLKSDI